MSGRALSGGTGPSFSRTEAAVMQNVENQGGRFVE